MGLSFGLETGRFVAPLPDRAILTGWEQLSRVNICAGMISLPQLGGKARRLDG
jgi:hypothetical protein